MKRTQVILLVVLALVALVVLFLALSTRQAPFLPGDEDHRGLGGERECVVCHGPDGALPRSTNHPLGEDCYRCHAAK